MRWCVHVVFLAFLGGCAAIPKNYLTASAPPAPHAGVVFVANGAGDSRVITNNLTQVVTESSVPLQVKTVLWSRGRVIPDQVDHGNHLAQGRKLAEQVIAYRQAYPDRRIYLLGQSAGCAVVLSAAELLPPDSVDRIVLLCPSVCATYDLRLALRSARDGIDGFHSHKDRWVLGLSMRIVGTTDGDCRIAAGRVGFTPIVCDATDAVLYSKLRQHPWDRSLRRSGNNGGHFGNDGPVFLRAYVLPLLEAPGRS